MVDAANGFEVVQPSVAEGGSAVVHKAIAQSGNPLGLAEGTVVALKAFKPTVLQVSNQVARIRQEADLGTRVQHPNVARAYGLLEGRSSLTLVLQWVDGSTLDDWVQRQRKDLAWTRARTIALDIIAGLGALHTESILHRDVKPENIMVSHDESAVLMDIGVAEIADDNEHTLHTELKDFLGSVRYASPQFVLGEPFQVADDIYSLGLTLYYLFSGHRAYEKIQRKPVLPIRVVEGPPSIDGLRSNVPKPMKILLQACVHRDRLRRPGLAAIAESINNPDSSSFLTEELARQAAEGRSYPILKVMNDGATFYADLGGDEPKRCARGGPMG
jgi:serine/threonine-protein kinase